MKEANFESALCQAMLCLLQIVGGGTTAESAYQQLPCAAKPA